MTRANIHKPGAKKDQWLSDHPGQVLLTAGQILWTADCERALTDADVGPRRALKALRKKWVGYLGKLTALTRGTLSPVERAKVGLWGAF
jgi:dynein heavy chain